MCPIPIIAGQIIYIILQFIVLALLVIATPLPVFRMKSNTLYSNYLVASGYTNPVCATVWGITEKCYGVKYVARGNDAFGTGVKAPFKYAFGCAARRDAMAAASAFAIISIVFSFLLFVCGLLMLTPLPFALLAPVIFQFLSVITILIAWACVAGVYNNRMCKTAGSFQPSRFFRYDAGFGLMVAAWAVDVINLVWLILIAVL